MMLKFAVSIILCGLATTGSFGNQNFRLPTFTYPYRYDLQFYPVFNGANSMFTGVAKILIFCETTTNLIVLNQNDLTVNTVSVTDIRLQKNQTIIQTISKPEYEQYEIYLKNNLTSRHNYLLTITYAGKIRNDMTGLYMSSYEEGNQTKWMAVTNFKGPFARRAFPCYDEPRFKSNYHISVVKPKNMIALSNNPILKTERGPTNTTEVVYFQGQWEEWMSTYLAAIFVGEFLPSNNGSHLTVYTHKGYIDQTQYITKLAPKHLHVLEWYTGIKYILHKMDLLAIPDLYYGAMENWGMNTYREYYLLLNDDAKTNVKMRALMAVQHEFTHQWFGNLVTCSWWDYTWLNEGFATYFQYFATEMVNPDWRLNELFVIDQHQKALAYDQRPRHPITASTDDLMAVLDTITNSKAASVLRMLKYWVNENEDIYRESLRYYLDQNKYKSVSPEDLFEAFDTIIGDTGNFENKLSVYQFMTNWTTQSGYPVLNIVKNQTTFSIVQSPFFVNAADGVDKSAAWLVGLTLTTELSKNFSCSSPSYWTNVSSRTTVIPAPRNLSGWYIFNIQSSGFYRVNYDAENWELLTRQLNNNFSDIHLLNRAQLIDDSFALAEAGQLNYSVALSLSNYLKNETDAIPYYSAMNSLSYLLERMPRCKYGYEKFKTHVRTLAGIIYKRFRELVSQGTTAFHVLSFWDTFATWACSLDDDDCNKDMMDYFEKWQTGGKIPADIKDAAFCVGVKKSNSSSVFDKMFDVFTTTKTFSEKFSAQAALACSTNKTQLNQYLYHVFDGPKGPIKLNDFDSVVTAVSKTPIGLNVLVDFLSTNLNKILNEVPNGESIVSNIYSTLAEKVTNDDQIEKIKNLKDNTTIPAKVKKSFDESYEKVNRNLVWFNAYSAGIIEWSLVQYEADLSTDFDSVVTAVSKTPIGLIVLYDFLSINLNKILNEVPNGERIVSNIYSTLAEKVTNDDQIENIKHLKDNTTIPASVKKWFDESYEKVYRKLVWFNAYSAGSIEWSLVQYEADLSTDFDSVVTAVSKTPIGLIVLYDFLSTNLNKILNEVPNGERIVSNIYSTLAEKVTNDDQIENIKHLKDNTTIPASVKKWFDESYEKVYRNLVWFNAYSAGIIEWSLVQYEGDPTNTPQASTSTAPPTPSASQNITSSTITQTITKSTTPQSITNSTTPYSNTNSTTTQTITSSTITQTITSSTITQTITNSTTPQSITNSTTSQTITNTTITQTITNSTTPQSITNSNTTQTITCSTITRQWQ